MLCKSFITRYAALWVGTLCSLWLFAVRSSAQQSGSPADLILHNGKILTVDESFSIAEAIAVRGNQIAAVGRNQEVTNLAGPNTRVIDLKGRTVMPGIIDTHNHIHDYAENAYGGEIGPDGLLAYPIDWAAVTTSQDVLNQVRAHLQKYKIQPGEWVYFANSRDGGDEQSKVMFDELTRWELDKVAPNNPIVMALAFPNVNGVVVNTAAFDIVWKKHEDFIKEYGRIWLNAAGVPEGHFEAPAVRLVLAELPEPPADRVAPLYRKYADEIAAQGVTTLSTRLPKYATEAFRLLESGGNLPIRMAYGLESYFGRTKDLENDLKPVGALMGTGTDMVWVISSAPSAMDGASTRSCTTLTRAEALSALDTWWPKGQCLMDVEYRGAKGAPIRRNYFREWISVAARDGARLASTHITGDRTVKLLLNMIEELQQQHGRNAGRNWAMDHCYMVDPADLPQAARLGVQFSCYIRMSGVPAIAKSFGEKVANTYPWPVKSMMKAGVTVAYEADSDRSIWQDLEDAMVRKDRSGKVWGPQERLNHEEVLRFFTSNGAKYVLRQNTMGSLEQGKFADLTVLDRDFLTTPPEQMGDMKPLLTITNGRIVFAQPQFAQENSLDRTGVVVATLEQLKARRNRLGISRR